MSIKRLYICEKPDQGKNLAKALGWEGGKKGTHIINKDEAITWGFGHMLSQASPDKYVPAIKGGWDLELLPIVPEKWVMVEPDPVSDAGKATQLKAIGKLIQQAKEIVIATDYDNEGEAIAVEMIEYFGYTGGTKRMKYAALDKKTLLKAVDDMFDGKKSYPMYLACLGRMRADWLLGMNMTMAFTSSNNNFLFRGDVLSAGRVQTPIIHLVVSRENEIKNFKPVEHFDINAVFVNDKGEKYDGKLKLDKSLLDEEGLFTNKEKATEIIKNTKGQSAVISEYTVEEKITKPPTGYSLDELQIEGINKFNLSTKGVLDIAQRLYETYKITSYPRTDSCFLPWNLHKDAQSTIRTINKNFGSDEYNAFLSKTDHKKKSPTWNDKKVTAHHAIIPVDNNFDVSKLTKDEFNIYDLVCRRYAMQFLDDYKYSSSKIKTKVANEIFETSGNVPLDQGWKIANKGGDKDKEKLLPLMKKGDNVKAEKITSKSKKTTPPAYYTEATILKDMANVQKFITNPNLKKIIKEGGIGTNATRAAHMENMFNKKFLVKEGKKLRATDKAFAIDDIAPKELKLPETTAYWEEELKLIVAGTLTLDKFMEKQDKILKRMIDKVKNGECQLKKPVSGGAGKTYTCDKCNSLIARIKSKKGSYFWACQNQKDCNSLYQDNRGKKGDLIVRVEQPKGDFPCPKCKNQMLRRQNKTNKEFFWVCSDEKCKTFCKDTDGKLGATVERKAKATSEHKCPKCNEGRLVKRGGKNGDFWGCNNFPKCKTAVQDDNGKPQAPEDKK